MFGQLEDIERRFEEVLNELSEPGTTGDQKRFQRLMKEQADLTPLVETYREYRKAKQDGEDAIAMLEEEKDPDMREMLKEEHSAAKEKEAVLEEKLKVMDSYNLAGGAFWKKGFDNTTIWNVIAKYL